MAKQSQNERVKLEMKILKYRELVRQLTDSDGEATQRVAVLLAELEQNLREIDE